MKRNFKRIFALCTAFVLLFQNAVYAASLGAGGNENVFEAFEMSSDESASPSQAMQQSGFFKAGQETVLYLDKGNIEITNNEIRAYDTNGNPVTKTVNENTLVMLVTKEKAVTQNFVSIKDSKVKLGIKDINFEGASFIRTEGECELSLFLYGENKLVNTNHDKALMHVNENSVFRLGGEGSLDFSAEHGPDSAFIGGDAGNKNGKIIIDSGKIKAVSNGLGACVGSGSYAAYSDIEINGGDFDLVNHRILGGPALGSASGKGNGTIKITGGKFKFHDGWGGTHIGASVYGQKDVDGVVSIEGGDFSFTWGRQIDGIRAGTVNISGGNINFSGVGIYADTVNISGGLIKFPMVTDWRSVTALKELNISGGFLDIKGKNIISESGFLYAPSLNISGGKLRAKIETGDTFPALSADYVNISGGSLDIDGSGKDSAIGVYDTLKNLSISGGSIKAKGGEQSFLNIGTYKSDKDEGSNVYPKDNEGRRVYEVVIENVDDSLRDSLKVDGVSFKVGPSIEGDKNLYLYLSEGSHEISYGSVKKTVEVKNEDSKKARLTFNIIDGISGENIEADSMEVFKDGVRIFTGKPYKDMPFAAGDYKVTVAKNGYYNRNFTFKAQEGKSDTKNIILNPKNVVETKVEAKEMTKDEIIKAGVDPNAPENKHLFKYKVTFEFKTKNRPAKPVEVSYIGRGEGVPLKTDFISVSAGEGSKYDIKVKPISERFYLVIFSQSTWLKEMYDVSLIVKNNSRFESLTNVKASLDELSEGISLAKLESGEQELTKTIENIGPMESTSLN